MEPRYIMTALFGLALVFVFGALFLMLGGRTKATFISLVLAVVTMGVFTYVAVTDDTPTWDERLEAKYDIEIGEVHEESLRQPGAWEIDGEWRTCMSPGFTLTKEDTTLLCQPVTPETEFEELAK